MLRFLKPKKSKPTRLPAAQGVEEGTNPCQSLRASSPTALPEDIDLRPLKHTPSTALNGLKFALAGLGAASSGLPLPGLASTANSVLVVLNKLEKSTENARGFADLADQLNSLLSMIVNEPEHDVAWYQCFSGLVEELDFLNAGIDRAMTEGRLSRFLNSTDNANSLANHVTRFQSIVSRMTLGVAMETRKGVTGLQRSQLGELQLRCFNSLSRVDDAAYNSSARDAASGCLPETRVSVLRDIHGWIGSEGPSLYWLCGMAGTGKTTIAHSIAEFYDQMEKKLLGASFFFSRDQQKRRESRYLFQTIAFQLGNAFPVLKPAIAKVLEDQGVVTSNLQTQLRRLIIEPIDMTMESLPAPIVIVMDALDECEESDAIAKIVELFVGALHGRLLPLRVFVTSRPESHIRSTFHLPEVYLETRPFILHEIQLEEVQKDIDKFVRFELGRIMALHVEILKGEPWPKEEEIQALVHLAAGLFIAAATMLKFVCPDRRTRDLKTRLALILTNQKQATLPWMSHPFHYLDSLYAKILDHAVEGIRSAYIFERFRTIVGMIVLAFSFLTVQELETLLHMPGQVEMALGELHSVIFVPNGGGPVQTFHLSFHDFLTDHSRCIDPRFFINPAQQHAQIARFCMERMKSVLQRDICRIGDPSKINDQVEDIKERKAKYLPGDVQYACRYWASHVCNALIDEALISLVRSFAFTSILHWIEVLSLIGELNGGLRSLGSIQAKLQKMPNPPQDTLQLLNDTERFLFDFFDGIAASALQIYHSALPFTPKETVLYTTFAHEAEGSPVVLSGVSRQWDACLRLMGCKSPVTSVAISHDGTRIVTGSIEGIVHLWDAQTGEILRKLQRDSVCKGCSTRIEAVTISSDGSCIIAGCADETIRVWDAITGILSTTLEGHADWVKSVAIASDETHIISCSSGQTIHIWDMKSHSVLYKLDECEGPGSPDDLNDDDLHEWDTQTGSALHKLEGCSGRARSYTISHDGTRIISLSMDNTVNDEANASLLQAKGHSHSISSVAISPDGMLIVSGSLGNHIHLWDVQKGLLLQVFEGHTKRVKSVVMSHDQTLIVSGSLDTTICIWKIQGAHLHRLHGHKEAVNSVAISKDGMQIVSGSNDRTIRVWNAKTGEELHVFEGHSNWVSSVAISHDGTRIVSGSLDNTIRIWDACTDVASQKLDGHQAPVNTVAISHDGTRVVSGSLDTHVHIWDAESGELLHKLVGHTKLLRLVAISYDGTLVISGSLDMTVRIWSAQGGEAIQTLRGHEDMVSAIAISYDCTIVTSGSLDNTVRIWNIQDGALFHKLEGHTAMINQVDISRDNVVVVSCSDDKTVRIWNTKNGTLLHQLDGHTSWVNTAVISQDGTRVISGADDCTARLWNVQTGEALAVLKAPDIVRRLQFSPDEGHFISHSHSFTIPQHLQPRCPLLPNETYLPLCFMHDGWLISQDGQTRLCWVPLAYRGVVATNPPLVVFGTCTARVVILQLPKI